MDYEKNVNYADFDGMTLYKEEFGNTFTYDDDGNVTAVKDLVGQKAKAQYDDYNNLISYVQPGRPDTVKTTISYGSSDEGRRRSGCRSELILRRVFGRQTLTMRTAIS